MKPILIAGTLLLGACRTAPEPPRLSLGEVVQMSKAQLAPGTIIARIRGARLEQGDLTPQQVIALHEEGLDPQVLSALVRAAAGEEVPPYVPPPESEEEAP